ncbi:hypothetical protein FS749_008483 [Ceratobasidium sp. UAMH 11750]|nr:hypothetical protein FS749_008483 [Ceratobasidium sp. UAMH 11750]
MSTQPWKCALVTGGGGGLGKAFARSLVNRGKKVYIAGRTESNLVESAKEIGAAGYFVVDIADLVSLPSFVNKVIGEVPEIDCLINNAAILFVHDFTKGAELGTVHREITTNVTSLVDLCGLFVPHLMKQEHACVMNIGAGLGYIPNDQFPIYCASKVRPFFNNFQSFVTQLCLKAFVKYFTLSLREQLHGTNVKVIEISPPFVNLGNLGRSFAPTKEHIEKLVEGLRKKNIVGLTEEQWMAAVEKGWDEGKEEIGAGFSQMGIDKWREAFGPAYSMRTSIV